MYFAKGIAILAPFTALFILALWADPMISGAIIMTVFALYFSWLIGYIISSSSYLRQETDV